MSDALTRRTFVELAAGAVAVGAAPLPLRAAAPFAPLGVAAVQPLRPAGNAPEPYAPLHGGDFTGPAVPFSPDPLVRYRWADPKAADDLQIYEVRPVKTFAHTPHSFENLASATTAACAVRVVGTGSMRFDFGVENPAWIEFDSPDFSGAVEMSISEYDEPEVVNPPFGAKTKAPVRYGNTFRLELNKDLYEGVRFGWIHVRQFERPWHVTAVRAVCQAKPTNYNGQFACSDDMLTRIWYTGAYDVRANFCKDYFGAILIDRGDRISWTGDAHTAQAAALVAFGNWDFVKLNIDRTAGDSNGIESYALYWVLSLLSYYQHTGDAQELRKHLDRTQAMLAHAESIYADPPISYYGWDERLGGFREADQFETKSAYRMLYVHACVEFAAALESIGRSDLAATYTDTARQKMKALRGNEAWFRPYGVHALADTVNTGLTSSQEQESIFAQAFSDRLNRLSYSPFNQYFLLQAMARMNRFDEALVSTRDMWGGQIEYGGTTFFEVFAPSWNQCIPKNGPVPNCQCGYTSLAHPWGAGVTAWLSHEILGIKPTAPGFSRVDVTPHLGRTLTWVSGSMPTPNGPVSARFDVRSGSGEVTIPPGSIGRIGVPIPPGLAVRRVAVNGETAWDGRFNAVRGVGAATPAPDFMYLNDVQPGRYALSFSYAGKRETFESGPFVYPMNDVRQDTETGGNWGGVYGRDGYLLFSYDGVQRDRRHLPPYVVAVTPDGSEYVYAERATHEARTLAPNPSNAGTRSVGYIQSDTRTSSPTMNIDIAVNANTPYQLAFYFLDWEKNGRRLAVEAFDLRTLDRVNEVRTIGDFTRGVYVIFRCDRSVRIRIDQIRGKNAVLSGIFFDPVAGATPERRGAHARRIGV